MLFEVPHHLSHPYPSSPPSLLCLSSTLFLGSLIVLWTLATATDLRTFANPVTSCVASSFPRKCLPSAPLFTLLQVIAQMWLPKTSAAILLQIMQAYWPFIMLLPSSILHFLDGSYHRSTCCIVLIYFSSFLSHYSPTSSVDTFACFAYGSIPNTGKKWPYKQEGCLYTYLIKV